MTAGELERILLKWPDDTVVFVNVDTMDKEPTGEYEWHDFTINEPSDSEIEHYAKTGEATYVQINILPGIVGC